MSREHLYKAKRVNWMELPKEEWWVEGNLLISDEDYYIIPDFGVSCVEKLNNYVCDKLITLHAFEVEKETICEYTGLNNKNSRKIFENDILNVTYSDQVGECHHEENYLLEDLRNTSVIGWLDYANELEIVGNIFDNPELLEGGEAE